MTVLGKFTAVTVGLALVSEVAHADVYMHNPRGSNNRNCRNDNNTNRRNGNRLFDSQNNDKGGYSCPQAYPFSCYDNQCNNGAEGKVTLAAPGAGGNGVRAADNNQAQQAAQGGNLMNTPTQYFYAGSVMSLEFTAQHGLGDNPKVRTEAVIQWACEDTMPASRDGLTVRNNGGNNKKDEATNTIPRNADAQTDAGYGRHESLEYYNRCRTRARAQGLYTADQNLNGNSAIYSRQNPNGNRNGLECPEESEYYPYWAASPWKDMALVVSDPADCKKTAASQNLTPRAECVGNFQRNDPAPLSEAECTAAAANKNAQWVVTPAHNIAAPSCWVGPRSRANHLGNTGGRAVLVSGDSAAVTVGGEMSENMNINFTIPQAMVGKGNCVVRLRYNMSTLDTVKGRGADGVYIPFTSADNKNTLVADRNNREVLSYKNLAGLELTDDKYKVGTAVNTNQYGRTFQDRSYVFTVKAAPAGGAIYNLNVRGKRGNIVQAYPSVEYDFTPAQLEVGQGDRLHIAFAGSDYNPNRNPNNGEGGPSNPNNDNEAKSDRTNLVPMAGERSSFMAASVRAVGGTGMPKAFAADVATYQKLAMTTQMDAGVECKTIEQLRQQIGGNNANQREKRERFHTNCGKLSAQKTPIFDAGIVAAGTPGKYSYINSRNNNLSNRGQKGSIEVLPPNQKTPVGALPNRMGAAAVDGPGFAGNGDGSDGDNTLVMVGAGAAGLAAVGMAFAAYRSMNSQGGSTSTKSNGKRMTPRAGGGGEGKTVSARYAHNAKEAGELSFSKGDKITVLRQDASGWWEGRLASGASGIFPSNYVQ
jgi:hypothetical protein